jgi:hypothetical protein
MLAVMLMCAAPVIASYFTYYVIRPEGRSVYGELIDPQHELPKLVATDRNGAPVDFATLKGQWLLVAVADAACDALCEQQLYLQRQLRESLGREKDRMDRVWLVSDAAPVPERLNNGLRGATVLRVPADQTSPNGWRRCRAIRLAEHLYVVDPMGNWMMRFPARMDAAGAGRAKRDLDRLLRASSVVGRTGPLNVNPHGHVSSLYDLTPIAWLMAAGVLIALGPLPGCGVRNKGAGGAPPACADAAHAVPHLRPDAVRRLHPAHRFGPGLPRLARLLRQRQPGRARQ